LEESEVMMKKGLNLIGMSSEYYASQRRAAEFDQIKKELAEIKSILLKIVYPKLAEERETLVKKK